MRGVVSNFDVVPSPQSRSIFASIIKGVLTHCRQQFFRIVAIFVGQRENESCGILHVTLRTCLKVRIMITIIALFIPLEIKKQISSTFLNEIVLFYLTFTFYVHLLFPLFLERMTLIIQN